MNSRVIVLAPLKNMQRGTSLIFFTGAIRRNRLIIRSRQCVSDAEPQTELLEFFTLGNIRVSVNMGKEKRVLPVGHSPSPIVAPRAHATRGNGPKAKAENNRKERKPAAPFTTLYIALKADNVAKSAAK
jgi:hypothetical protein